MLVEVEEVELTRLVPVVLVVLVEVDKVVETQMDQQLPEHMPLVVEEEVVDILLRK
jgi:hypothetical protein